jgi:tetratricopeptide (TPR) repeat protein
MNLGMLGQAEQTFRYMRQLSPTSADAYYKIAQVQVAQGKLDQAAVSCMQCIFIDKNSGDAWKLLNDIYQHLNTSSQPCLSPGPNGHLLLNLSHPLVRMNLLDAYRSFIRIFRAANRPQLVQTAANTALNDYRFPAELVNSVLNEPLDIPVPANPIYYKPGTKADIPGGTMH